MFGKYSDVVHTKQFSKEQLYEMLLDPNHQITNISKQDAINNNRVSIKT